MPTGSLCAERNVIGSALADDLTLLRRDIKAVAVLGLTLGRNSDVTVPSSVMNACSLASSVVHTPPGTPCRHGSPQNTGAKALLSFNSAERSGIGTGVADERLEGVRQVDGLARVGSFCDMGKPVQRMALCVR